ncbi:AraC family transcriptional regulator [Allorhizobium undicola]|uniref:AraC family transcriptional regulator n=1 Tax=Allorhizobium undicola TaxID=78527 RepID=UPI000687357E|nr:AraC family transcriptional regulator [Allorhizobium undicola]
MQQLHKLLMQDPDKADHALSKPKAQTAVTGKDADSLSFTLSSSQSPVRVDAQAGPLDYRWNSVSLGSHTISLASYEGVFKATRQNAIEKHILLMPLSGTALVKDARGERISSPEKATIMECDAASGLSICGVRQHLAVVLDNNAIRHTLEKQFERPLTAELSFVPEWDIASGTGFVLRNSIQSIYAELCRRPELLDSEISRQGLSATLASMVGLLVPHNFSDLLAEKPASAEPKQVRRALDFMQAHLDRPISVEDIAAASGVGVRALQQAFKDFKSTTPMACLQDMRMAAVRRELLEARPGESVSSISARWGFTHAGRFAIEYRRRFGQSPSDTLRR